MKNHPKQSIEAGIAGIYAYNDTPPSDIIRPLSVVERETIERAIDAYDGNIAQAASALRISPSTIYRKQAQWKEIDDKDFNV